MSTVARKQLAHRAVLVDRAIRIVAHEGWQALSNRRLEVLTRIDRSTISAIWPAEGGAREKHLITLAFDRVRDVASKTTEEAGQSTVNIGWIQDGLLDLFRTTDMPTLMARVSSLAGLAGEQLPVAAHFAEERGMTVRHVQAHCYSELDGVQRLIDWYIAACTVFVTKPDVELGGLKEIGRLLGKHSTAEDVPAGSM